MKPYYTLLKYYSYSRRIRDLSTQSKKFCLILEISTYDQIETSLLVKGLGRMALGDEESLQCHIRYDTAPRFTWSHPKDRLI